MSLFFKLQLPLSITLHFLLYIASLCSWEECVCGRVCMCAHAEHWGSFFPFCREYQQSCRTSPWKPASKSIGPLLCGIHHLKGWRELMRPFIEHTPCHFRRQCPFLGTANLPVASEGWGNLMFLLHGSFSVHKFRPSCNSGWVRYPHHATKCRSP